MRPPIDIAVNSYLSPTASQGNYTLSPTDCPGPTEFPTGNPMFPDMKRDDFMSKSTASTRETSGDFWSISATSDDQYKPYHLRYRGYQDTQGQRGGRVDKLTENQYNGPNRDVSQGTNRPINAMEWRQEQPPLNPRRDFRLPNRPSSRPRERSEFTGESSSRRLGEIYDGRVNGTFQHSEMRDRVSEHKRPQHQYDDDEYPPHRSSLGAYGEKETIRESPVLNRQHATPKSKIERSPTFELGTMQASPGVRYRKDANQNYQGGRGQDDGRHERFFTELRRDGSFSGDNTMYEQPQVQRGNQGQSQEEPGRWYPVGGADDRFGDQDDSERFYEQRRGRIIPNDTRRRSHYKEEIHGRRIDELRENCAKGHYYTREEGFGTPRTYDDDWSTERFESNNERRKGIRPGIEDIEDSSSISFSHSELSGDGRVRGRSTSRGRSAIRSGSRRREPSTERNRQIGKGKSSERKGTKPSEFFIDIVQPGVESGPIEQETIISPSRDDSKFQLDKKSPPVQNAEDSFERERYAKRIADANLMKEQSEARHQILIEVRQAMEMRDLSTDANNRQFWERQVKALNTSLKRLWDVDGEGSVAEEQDNALTLQSQKLSNGDFQVGEPTTPRQSNTQSNKVPTYQSPSHQSPHQSSHQSPTILSPTSINNFTTVKVQAPENLPADHQFTIRVNGKQMKARVPSGGVCKGDVFTIRIPLDANPVPSPSTPSFSRNSQSPSLSVNNSTVKVRAPASMPEGYRFTAKMGDKTIVATVPRGGVQKGEIFVVRVDQ
eukprot:CAMPEP_0194234712 /NCGR_PEP_ID=MMETSP0158-20130606/2373_1 /TAXON_ID=33649 /ORGANISM="Thalassionema nitzschioides, Strain L26-B" /LENGTH=776 /DNA_ID=CAMNT_0038967977 /DNA_START=10 /DNA_END=2340 /DNA_ORIENTATION=+